MTGRTPESRDLLHLLDLQLPLQELLSVKLHGEVGSREEHGVPVSPLLGSDPVLSPAVPGTSRSAAVTGDGEAAGREAACPA